MVEIEHALNEAAQQELVGVETRLVSVDAPPWLHLNAARTPLSRPNPRSSRSARASVPADDRGPGAGSPRAAAVPVIRPARHPGMADPFALASSPAPTSLTTPTRPGGHRPAGWRLARRPGEGRGHHRRSRRTSSSAQCAHFDKSASSQPRSLRPRTLERPTPTGRKRESAVDADIVLEVAEPTAAL